MKRYLILMLGCVVAAGLIAAGCGSDDNGNDDSSSSTSGTGTDTTASLSKAQWIEQADAICKESNDTIEAGSPGNDATSQEVDAYVTDTIVPAVQSQLDDIRALGTPTEEGDQADAIIQEAQTALDQLKSDPTALSKGQDPFADANADAQAFGLKECGS
jgi:hypothetical protein